MKRILVDTSVWIEFFSPRPKISEHFLEQMKHSIIEGEVAIIEPIRVELLSGGIRAAKRKEVALLLAALTQIDLDWNSKETWNKLIDLSDLARIKKVPVPGVIDRMILLSAREASAHLWTVDQSLRSLALCAQVPILRGN
jgi:predicted nucleic acid-binding protein